MLRTFFNKLTGRKMAPENWLSRRDVDSILMTQGKCDEAFVRYFSEGDDFARCRYELSADGKKFSFDMHLRRDGQNYKTAFRATLPQPDAYVVDSFRYEDRRVELKKADEIYAALDCVGRQIRDMVYAEKMAAPHGPDAAPAPKKSPAYMRFFS